MFNYKPLYGNPAFISGVSNPADEGTIEVQAIVSGDVPGLFVGKEDLWEALLVFFYEYDEENMPAILDLETFESLPAQSQNRVLGEITQFEFNVDANPDLAAEQLIAGINAVNNEYLLSIGAPIEMPEEEIIGTVEIEGPPVPQDREMNAELVNQALARVFAGVDLSTHDIFNVLLGIVEEIQDIGVAVTVEHLVEALESFLNIAFPTYVPEELVACVYLTVVGDSATLDAEEEGMIVDNSRADALCSSTNQAIVLAAFGSEAAAKFTQFCAAAPASRMTEWEDVAGRNLHTLIGVSREAFEKFALDAFDEGTAANLAAAGSSALTTLIESVVDDTKKSPGSVIREPRPTKDAPVGETKSAEGGPSLLVSGAVIAGGAVGLTALYRKIR